MVGIANVKKEAFFQQLRIDYICLDCYFKNLRMFAKKVEILGEKTFYAFHILQTYFHCQRNNRSQMQANKI